MPSAAPANEWISTSDSVFELDKFNQEFADTITHASGYLYQRVRADEIRYNIWDGQSEDGRKWAAGYGKQPFPWEGAADTRTFFVDECINESVEMCLLALKRARIQATPVADSSTLGEATTHTEVLEYVIKNKIQDEWDREWEAVFQWMFTYGLSLMSIYWRRETDIEEVEVSIQDILQIAVQDQNLRDMLSKVKDQTELSDSDYEALGEILNIYFPGIQVRSSINSLLSNGSFTYNREYFRVNRPTVRALRVLEDVFFPINTYCCQDAKWIVRRDILTVAEVWDRAKIEGWDPEFTQQVINSKGNSIIAATYYNTWRVRITNNVFVDDVWDRCEVYYAYTHEVDYNHKRRTMETVFHPSIHVIGKREIFDYDHGKFPFVEFPRERVTRSILESRGVPQILGDKQAEIKLQRDSRIDRTSLATLPPLKVPLGRGRVNIQMGPSTQLPCGPTGDYAWLQPPPLDAMSLQVEMQLQNDAKTYLGQYNDQADPNKILARQQTMINRVLGGARMVCTQVYQLCQQYLSDQDVQAVTKQPGASMHANRQAIQGEFDLDIEFDARDLNMEFLTKKLEAINNLVAPNDVAGEIDRSFLTRFSAFAVDPSFARQGLKQKDAVTQKEIEDEKNNLAQIAVGIEPPMVDKGQNYPLRLQVIANTLQTSPVYQQEIQQSPDKQKILQNRLKFLQFQVQQQQNAQIGRVGTSPLQGQI
jgi:hypothetical protein